MKLGIVTEEQFKQEVQRNTVSVSPEILPLKSRGRSKGDVNVPESVRKLIADEALTNGREQALLLAQDFGISPSSVSAYSHGATSTASYSEPDRTLTNYLNARKQRITKKALRVLQNSLDTLTPEKLNGIKARDAASIAKDMSTIANNMSDKDNVSEANRPKFVIYAPQIRDERSYEQIIVTDNY